MASAATNSPTEIDPKARFFRYFQHEVTALQEEMARLGETGVSGGERADGVEHCLAGIARLSNEVKESSSRIPVYDLRTYDEAIKALSEKLQKTRASFAPRPKFTFKSAMRTRSSMTSPKKEDRGRAERRIEELSGPKSAPATMQDNPVNRKDDAVNERENENGAVNAGNGNIRCMLTSMEGTHTHEFESSVNVSVSNHEGTHVTLPDNGSLIGNISDIHHCVVDLSAPALGGHPLSSLAVKYVTESLIVDGDIRGPVHITGLERCVIVVASRQFRMHDCKNCDVYLHCSSRPIVERCKGISFAPLPETYTKEFQRQTTNKYDQVDDFNWLKAEHSPHWRVLPLAERIEERVWQTIVPREADVNVENILQVTKVIR
ncbi:MAG: hypothetical protein Q9165_001412 [Trypethelium subeluteriae]